VFYDLHAPERQPGESMGHYRARRYASNIAVRAINAQARDSNRESSRTGLRNAQRKNGSLKSGAFGAGVIAAAARRALDKRQNRGPRDEHGSYTQTGRDPRRKWLAGISAQRGF
jgi:hypothetical protein